MIAAAILFLAAIALSLLTAIAIPLLSNRVNVDDEALLTKNDNPAEGLPGRRMGGGTRAIPEPENDDIA
jgi:hypothetical protein